MRYTKEEFVKSAERVSTLCDLMTEIYSVEDVYLEEWLMCGIANGTTYGEMFDDCLSEEQYMEWYGLATDLLKARAENEEEEE